MLTKRHKIATEEGFRSKLYKCTEGKQTIGYGFNVDDTEMPIEVADLWLAINIGKIEEELNKFSWYSSLNYSRQLVLVDMCYQMGLAGVLEFKNMISAIERRDFDAAKYHLLDSLYASEDQTPERAERNAEIMRTGEV